MEMDLLHMLADHDPKPPPNLQLAALAVQSRGEKRKRPGDPAPEVFAKAKKHTFYVDGKRHRTVKPGVVQSRGQWKWKRQL